tara:strand:+ start:24236 stop:24910 length:675 start_codon:yes stop_codon:yes gene_type:complete
MIKQLTKLANSLDSKGLRREADSVDSIIRKIAAGDDESDFDIKQFMEDTKERRHQSAGRIEKWLAENMFPRDKSKYDDMSLEELTEAIPPPVHRQGPGIQEYEPMGRDMPMYDRVLHPETNPGSIAFDMEDLFGYDFESLDGPSLSEADPELRSDVEIKLKEVIDPNNNEIVTLEELIDGLENMLGMESGALGSVTSKGWEDVNWELLATLINPSMDEGGGGDD